MTLKYIRVPCGGWIQVREANAHTKKCEMCEAMLDYNQEKFNHKANIVAVLLAIGLVSLLVWLWL